MSSTTRRFIGKLALLGGSTLFSLLATECAIAIAYPQNRSGSWRLASPLGNTVNKSEGSARHELWGRVVHYHFSPPHLRGPAPKEGSHRILLVGDSFAFGWLLDEEATTAQQLQTLLDTHEGADSYQILNGSAGGWGTANYVHYVEEFGPEVQPDTILVFLNTDDIGRSIRTDLFRFPPASPELERVVPPPRAKLKRLLNSLPIYQFLLERSHTFALARNVFLGHSGLRTKPDSADPTAVPKVPGSAAAEDPSQPVQVGNALFGRLRAWCAERDVRLIVATTGFSAYVQQEDEPTRIFMAQAPSFFEEQGVPFCDIADQLGTHPHQSIIIPGDDHPSEEGARLIAEYSFPCIQRHLSTTPSPPSPVGPPEDDQG